MSQSSKSFIKTGDKNFVEIVSHAFWALLMLGGTTVLQFIFDFILTHSYGAHGSGVFYLCFSVVMVLGLIGRLGLDQAVVRFIPPLLKTNPGAASGVRKSAVELSLLLTIPLAIGLFVLSPWLADTVFHAEELAHYLRLFAFAVIPFSLMYIFSGTLRAMKHTRSALSVERAGMYAFGIVAILTAGRLWGLDGVIVGFAASIALTAALGAFHIHRYMPKFKTIIPFDKKRLLLVSIPLLFVAFASQMNGQASVLILGAAADHASVAIFNIALKVSMLMSLILAAVNVIAATKISELYAADRKEELSIMISKISALGTLLGLPLLIVMSVFSTFLLGLFGKEFEGGSVALIILTIGQFINVAVGSTNYILAMTGHEKALAVAVGISLLANIVLGLILIPPYGVIGASISASTAMALSNIIMVFVVKQYLNVWALPFKYLLKWIKAR